MKAIILILSFGALLGCKSVSDEDMWYVFTDSVNLDIRGELRGQQPTAGHDTWERYWAWKAELLRKDTEGGRHIQYIIEQRRKAELPEIPELLE